MSKQEKTIGETQEQGDIRRLLESVANTPNRSDKVSWNRKMDNMVKLIAKMKPFQEQILELEEKKAEVFDEIQKLRTTMVAECIHPFDHLVYKEHYVYCKFCERRIVPNATNKKEQKS